MTCQRCRDEATVHLTETIDGRARELHLCGSCARAAGLAVPSEPPELALDAVLQGLIAAHVGELVGELARRRCPCCGTTFRDFRVDGRLGCPHDYQAFAAGLASALRRTHDATRHVGKVPRRPPIDAEAILRLRGRMRQAIEAEDYETAARLRDQIRTRSGEPQA